MIQRTSLSSAFILAVLIGSLLAADEPQGEGEKNTAGHHAEVNGFTMYYEIHGEGEPLVLLHGFTGSAASWEFCVEDFAKHYKLIIPDLRGHGHSTNSTSQFTHRQAALDVYALLDELKIDKFRGMGMSTGGMALIHMATQQPERAEAIVLIGATCYMPEQARENMRQTTVEGLTEQRWQDLRRRHKHGDDQIRALINQFHQLKDNYDDVNFTPPFLSTIRARTFVVHGDRDRYFPVNIPMEMYRSIPNCYLWIIPNWGHAPLVGTDQTTLIEKSLAFLKGDWEANNAPR